MCSSTGGLERPWGERGGTFKLLVCNTESQPSIFLLLFVCVLLMMLALVGVIRVEEGEVGESIDRVQPSSQPKSCKTQPIAQRE